MAQNIIKKQGLLFLRSHSSIPLEGVFVEQQLIIDSTLDYNMLLLDTNKNTGAFVFLFPLYKKNREFENKVASSFLFENTNPMVLKSNDSKPDNDNYSSVLPVQLTFVMLGSFEMNSGIKQNEYNTPIGYKGKEILSRSIYSYSKEGILDNMEIINLPVINKY